MKSAHLVVADLSSRPVEVTVGTREECPAGPVEKDLEQGSPVGKAKKKPDNVFETIKHSLKH